GAVRQPRREPAYEPNQMYDERIAPAAALATTNLWRIIISAAIVLVAVFGLVFLLTRGSGQSPAASANVNPGSISPGLVPDPNSQPVQQAEPPTAESEREVQARPAATAATAPTMTPTPRSTNS